MHIGLSGRTTDIDRIVEQAAEAEADGFSALWYAGGAGGDALLAATFAGRSTSTIEVGTAVLQTYPCHPVLQAARAIAATQAVGGGRLTLGLGPSHQRVIEGMLGMSYARPGRHTEEYVQVLTALLRGEPADLDGEELQVHSAARGGGEPLGVLLAALGPRLLRVAAEQVDGTITWMANAAAIERHVRPRLDRAAAAVGRASPRLVAGIPVAVHDDVGEARQAAATQFAMYGTLPNYRRILAHGGADAPGDAVVVGDEQAVASQLEAMVAAGATDIWADVFPVGEDRAGSRARTRALLQQLAG